MFYFEKKQEVLERAVEFLEKIIQEEEDDEFYNQKIKRGQGRLPNNQKNKQIKQKTKHQWEVS